MSYRSIPIIILYKPPLVSHITTVLISTLKHPLISSNVQLFESLAGTVAVVPTAMLQQIEKGGAAKAKKKAKEGKDGKDKEAPVLTAVAVTVP
tara:strand:- start:282 stop:560 length:279 start_codon:yes stop_codon:yes gene_type:complete